jgi:hypothetical protein
MDRIGSLTIIARLAYTRVTPDVNNTAFPPNVNSWSRIQLGLYAVHDGKPDGQEVHKERDLKPATPWHGASKRRPDAVDANAIMLRTRPSICAIVTRRLMLRRRNMRPSDGSPASGAAWAGTR